MTEKRRYPFSESMPVGNTSANNARVTLDKWTMTTYKENPFHGWEKWVFAFDEWAHRHDLNTRGPLRWVCNLWDKHLTGGRGVSEQRDALRDAIRAAWDAEVIPNGMQWRHAELAELAVDVIGAFWPDHFVVFTEDEWTVEHSMGCRLDGHMQECNYLRAVQKVAEFYPDPEDIGRWRIIDIDSEGMPSFEKVEE